MMLRSLAHVAGRQAAAAVAGPRHCHMGTAAFATRAAWSCREAAALCVNSRVNSNRTRHPLRRPLSSASGGGGEGGGVLSEAELRAEMDHFNRLFVDAREEIECAMESKETVYFDEEAKGAMDAVDAALAQFKQILDSVDEEERTKIMRSTGLKVEQLKAELGQVHEDSH